MARTYRKKPVVVEAVQWTGENHAEMCEFIDPEVFEIIPRIGLVIHTLEGDHHASPGDYIIKGVNGEFYPCKPDIFAKTYESSTLTQPNEGGKDKNVPTNGPLTLEELRLMIEPTPVWWDWIQGWVLARKGMIISWNGIYYNFEEVKGNFYRRPPEEPLTCKGCVHEINEHENCNCCIRAGYLGDYYYRSQDVLKNE